MKTTQLIGVHAVKQGGKDTTLSYMQEWCDDHDLPMVTRGFADDLKVSLIQLLFGVLVSPEVANAFFDEYKEDDTASVKLNRIQHAASGGSGAQTVEHVSTPCFLRLPGGEMMVADATVRGLLTRLGTDVARDRWSKDFWLDRLLSDQFRRAGFGDDTTYHAVWLDNFAIRDDGMAEGVSIQAHVGGIRDLRFMNELNRIRAFGGFTVKIRREEAEMRVIEEAAAKGREIHESDLLLADEHFDCVLDNNGTLEELRQQVRSFMDAYVRTTL